MRLGKIYTAIFTCIMLLSFLAQAHDEFYHIVGAAAVPFEISNGSMTGVITWPKQTATQIPIYFANWTSTQLPSGIDSATAIDEFEVAWNEWGNESGHNFGFTIATDPTNAIKVYFSYNSSDFIDPTDISETNGSVTSTNYWTCNTNIGANFYVVFNAFATNNFTFTTALGNISPNQACFQLAALHELGHVIGLSHCKYTNAVMYEYGAANGIGYYQLTSWDVDGVMLMTGGLTGIGNYVPPMPQNFTATIVGQDVVLKWPGPLLGSNGSTYLTPILYKNGTANYLPSGSSSYTDGGEVNSLPASYYLVFFDTPTWTTGPPSQPINVSISPGTINQFTRWTGVIYINSNVTINNATGVWLEIGPGTQVVFKGGTTYTLTANRQLVAVGQYNAPIVFTSSTGTSSWGSIVLNGPGANGSTISYANIQYGTEVDVYSANNVTVENCNITNNSGNGIYVNSSSNFLAQYDTIKNTNIYHGIYFSGGSNNNCYYNVISKTNHVQNGAGILYGGSSGTVGENDIDYYNWGIAGIWGASPSAYLSSSITKNNRVTNCLIGLYMYHLSYGEFGVSNFLPLMGFE